MVVEEVDWVLGVAAVVELVRMLTHGTVGIVAGVVAVLVAFTRTPHVHIAPDITHLHSTHTMYM